MRNTPLVKIAHGTPKSGKPLCHTCRRAQIIRGQRLEEAVLCTGPFSGEGAPGRVPFRIAECSEYHPLNTPFLHEMEGMAWKIEARRRGAVGFSEGTTDIEVVINPPKPRPTYE